MFYYRILRVIVVIFFLNSCSNQKEIESKRKEPSSSFLSVIINQSPEDKVSHEKMIETLSEIKKSTNDKNKYLGDRRARQVRDIINKADSQTPVSYTHLRAHETAS